MQVTHLERMVALAYHLELDKDAEVEVVNEEDFLFSANGENYLVLTDEEADAKAKEYILDSVWAFNADFLVAYLPKGMNCESIKLIQAQYENANEPLRAMIDDEDSFVDDAISADGRGHFMNSYDGNEEEQSVDGTTWYIYRV